MKQRPTIIDVAKRAGVSKSTVSRVIADQGQGVSEETITCVQQAVQELDYIPNAVASSMRTERTNIIMLTIPDITNPYWAEIARGVHDIMDLEDYAVVIANSDWDERQEAKYFEMARRNRFDGILINPVRVSNAVLESTNIPTVLLGTRDEYISFDRVGADSYTATKIAIQHLLDLGHRRIGLILGQRYSQSKDTRLAGYTDILQSKDIPIDEGLITTVPFTLKGGEAGLEHLLAQANPPTAVFCANDIIAIGVLQAARKNKLPSPEQLSIIGLDNIDASAMTTPPLTTVAKPKYAIGQQAARLLLERIRGATPPPRRVAFPCQLIERGSTMRLVD